MESAPPESSSSARSPAQRGDRDEGRDASLQAETPAGSRGTVGSEGETCRCGGSLGEVVDRGHARVRESRSSVRPRVAQQVPQQLTSTPFSSSSASCCSSDACAPRGSWPAVAACNGVTHEEDLDVLVAQRERLGQPEGVVRTLATVGRGVDDQQDGHATSSPALAVPRPAEHSRGPAQTGRAAAPPPPPPARQAADSPGPATSSCSLSRDSPAGSGRRAADHAAHDREDDEQPELAERPAADEQRRRKAARRVDRRVVHRDA